MFDFHTRDMLCVLVGMVLFFGWTLYRRNRSAQSSINLDDLMLGEDGRASKSAAVMLGSFALTSWLIVYLAIENRLSEVYFAGYLAAWVAPTVARLIKAPAPNSDGK